MPFFDLDEDDLRFPPAHLASQDGLLAVGGDLSRERLLQAYRSGIFPWYSQGDPILWWSPDPRLVLYPHELHVPKSLHRVINQGVFHITMDTAFEAVIKLCAATPRSAETGTWIVDEMITAYCDLHEAGWAHSVEAWQDGVLVGGLYGVAIGKCFYGESMFTKVSNASKVAFVWLVNYLKQHLFTMIDCQMTTSHMLRFGAKEISRVDFLEKLAHD